MSKKLLVLNVKLSGINVHLFRELRKLGWTIDAIEVPIPKIAKYINMIKRFKPNKVAWRDRFYETLGKDPLAFKLRTQFCEKAIAPIINEYDAILQIGGMFAPSFRKIPIPYATYNDYTMKLAGREYKPWNPFQSEKVAKKWYDMEGQLYKNAARVFTFSENTRRSVIEDYGAKADQVFATNAGVNFEILPDKTEKNFDQNLVLFVGIDFKRKGGFVVLDAFKKVKDQIKNARLVILGPDKGSIPCDIPDVEFKGLIKDREEVKRLYREATLFAMPSYGDPFPNAFFEAMVYQLPCIGSNISGMPEQIKDGETGFVIERGDSNALAEKILYLLQNKDKAKQMGEAGYDRVKNNFTWELVAKRMDEQLMKITQS